MTACSSKLPDPNSASSRLNRGLGRSDERGILAQKIAERAIPDEAGLFPRIAANLHRREVERVIWNSRIDVHTALILPERQLLEVVHRGGLRIGSEHGMIHEGGTRGLEGAKNVFFANENVLSNQPVGRFGILVGNTLLHKGAKNVRKVLVQRAALELVNEPGFVLGDAMAEFVANDVDV